MKLLSGMNSGNAHTNRRAFHVGSMLMLPLLAAHPGSASAFETVDDFETYPAGPVPPDPTPIGLGLSSGINQVSWPTDHIGWRLQSKTNLLDPEWIDVSGSSESNAVESSMRLSNSTVCYPIIYPYPGTLLSN